MRVRLLVRGRVQGVWFRGATSDEARSRGIAGWARNRPDGSVEILAQGRRGAIDELVKWCRHGPTGARVLSLERSDEPPGDDLDDFRIRG